MNKKDRRIVPISKLTGFRVAPGDADPRGWDVVGADGHALGVVRDLLVDREVMRVRYLEVELAGGERRTLLPIGTAQLDDATDRVLFHSLDPRQLALLPEYDYDTFSREYETSVLTRFGPGGGGAVAGAWNYESRHFDDGAFYSKRRNRYAGMARGERLDDKLTRSDAEIVLSRRVIGPADAGGAALPAEAAAAAPAKKRSRRATKSPAASESAEPTAAPSATPAESAATRPAGRTATRPAKRGTRTRGAYEAPETDAARAAADATAVRETDEEIVVPIVEEELVVERRPVVKEEIVIKKKAVRETRTVEADLRKERVDVEERTTRDPDAGVP